MRARLWGLVHGSIIVAVAVIVVSGLPSSVGALNDQPSEMDVLRQPVMSISTNGYLTVAQAARIVAAVRSVGATGHVVRQPTLPLTRIERGTRDVFSLGKRWRLPMATVVAPGEYFRAVYGPAVSAALRTGRVVMGEVSAALHAVKPGDVLTLRDRGFRPHRFVLGAVVSQEIVEHGDLLMSAETASELGSMDISRVSITAIPAYGRVLRALAKRGFTIGDQYRLRTSWDLPNPDGTLGLGTVKSMWGDFSFRPTYGAGMLVSKDWLGRNIIWGHRYRDVGLRNNCHREVIRALASVFAELKRTNLLRHIDVPDSRRAGGCFVGRYNRFGGPFGAPSRHAWGMAIDLNISTNPQWGIPRMNCDVVRVFRKWGFAWGGNFWPSDGMHFEYVGERRDQMGYPSKYCRNKVPVPSTTLPQFPGSPTTTSSTSTSTTTTTVPVPSSTTTITSTTTTTTSTTTTSTTSTTQP